LNSETKLHAYVSLEIKKMATIRVERWCGKIIKSCCVMIPILNLHFLCL
jgi:hypothetical protein